MSHIDFDSAILAARFCDGGHIVNGEDAERLPAFLPEPPKPTARRARALAFLQRGCGICAVFASGGFGLFIGAAVRHFFF